MDSGDVGKTEETFVEEGTFNEDVGEGVVGVPVEEDSVAILGGGDE